MKQITTLFSFLFLFLLCIQESQAQTRCGNYYEETSTVSYTTPPIYTTQNQKLRSTQVPVQYVKTTETVTYFTGDDGDRVRYDSAAKSRSGLKAVDHVVLSSKSMIREPLKTHGKRSSSSINQPRVIKNTRSVNDQHIPNNTPNPNPRNGGGSKSR